MDSGFASFLPSSFLFISFLWILESWRSLFIFVSWSALGRIGFF